tara:strand:- start:83 stop:322 length:240 start_codon:yes stop_codon:yes gene_type:complete
MKKNILLKSKIRKLIVKQFKLKKNQLKKNLSADNIDRWDSLGHLSLITNIEKKFKVSFSQEEIVKMLDEKEIYSTILKK